VEHIVKRGLRGDYSLRQDNLFALRGKLQMATHLRQNLCRRDRFFAAFDEFSTNRPENRLLHAALAPRTGVDGLAGASATGARAVLRVCRGARCRFNRPWIFSGCGWTGVWATTLMRWRGRG
jgi:hypothetical protein